MLIDLISTDNMISFNIKIAEVLGLNTAIYLNELMNIAMKAVRKKKLVADKFFIVDRAYVKSRTTISLEEQLAIDKKMVQMNIIQKANGGADEDSIYVDFELLAKMLSTDDEATLAKIGNRAAVKNTGSISCFHTGYLRGVRCAVWDLPGAGCDGYHAEGEGYIAQETGGEI